MRAIADATTDNSAHEKSLLEDGLDLYAHALALAKPSDQPNQATARMALASHNLNSLVLAAEAALTGFYLQSISLLRGVYENWIAFEYLGKRPQDSHYWLEANPHKRPPKVGAMRKHLDVFSERGASRADEMHSILHRFVHTDPIIALSLFRETARGPSVFVGIEFNQDAYRSAAYGIALLTGIMLDALAAWVADGHSWHDDADIIARRILEFLHDYNRNADPTAA